MLTKETPETFYIGKSWVCFLELEEEKGLLVQCLLCMFKSDCNSSRIRPACTVSGKDQGSLIKVTEP